MCNAKKRTSIPNISKVRAELQQEIGSVCPFCKSNDVGHFEIHHIDSNPSNHAKGNLILLCPTCHSKITKGDISQLEVGQRKITLLYNLLNNNPSFHYNALLTFEDESTEKVFRPRFKQGGTFYKLKPYDNETASQANSRIWQQQGHHNSIQGFWRINNSFFGFCLLLNNFGTAPIEEYKVQLEFKGDILSLEKSNQINVIPMPLYNQHIPLKLDARTMSGQIIPPHSILVGDDKFKSDAIYIKTSEKRSQIVIKWKLISKGYKTAGELLINVEPAIERNYSTVYVDTPEEIKTVDGVINEYLT